MIDKPGHKETIKFYKISNKEIEIFKQVVCDIQQMV